MNSDELNNIDKEDLELPYSENLDKHLLYIRKRITQLRLSENISERALSFDIGKGSSYIRQVTNGTIKPSLIPLLQLCERFSLEPREFFDSDIQNPTLLHEAYNALKKLNQNQLEIIIALLKQIEVENHA